MNGAGSSSHRENPFHAQRIRPGAIDFIFLHGASTGALVDKLRANGWRGAIIGPHGSGKSTLLHTLRPAIEAAGRPVVLFELHDGQRRLPMSPRIAGAKPGSMVIVDGYEQLSWWSKVRLHWNCRRLRCGLLVTAHQPVALPTLWETRTDEALAIAVVGRLTAAQPEVAAALAGDIARAYASHHGDIREMLFALYDLYRQRQGGSER